MTTDEIKQASLYELGFEDDLDFTSTDDNAVVRINFIYEEVMKSQLARYRWGFALGYAKLTTPTELTDDDRYKYRYDLPADFLFLRNQYANPKSHASITDYELLPDGFYTNQADAVYLEYTKRVDDTVLPSYFIEFIKYKLAFDLCYNLTGNTDLLQVMSEREKFEYINATNIDARQRKTQRITSSPFVDVRGAGYRRGNFQA